MEKKTVLNRLLTGTMVAGAITGTSLLGGSDLLAFKSLGSGAEVRGRILGSNSLLDNTLELKCGADANKTATPAKATDSKSKDAKCGEGKCGEGKCGDKKAEDKKAEAKPAATKSANPSKTTDGKTKDGKCGEGKCGK